MSDCRCCLVNNRSFPITARVRTAKFLARGNHQTVPSCGVHLASTVRRLGGTVLVEVIE